MKKFIFAASAIIIIAIVVGVGSDSESSNAAKASFANNLTAQTASTMSQFEYAKSTEVTVPDGIAIATFAGGEEVAPTYNQIINGLTGHREAIQFLYDPTVISYDKILDIFWRQSIDPTDAGGQFVDRGYIYTTAVYYHDDGQLAATKDSIQNLKTERDYEDVATELSPFTTFYPAEEYHQDYYKKSSAGYKRYESGSGRAEYRSSLSL